MKDLVKAIVMNLVDDEGAVEIKQIDGTQTSILEVGVATEDVGKIIGKEGNTARAIRTILKASGKKQDHKYDLNILTDR